MRMMYGKIFVPVLITVGNQLKDDHCEADGAANESFS